MRGLNRWGWVCVWAVLVCLVVPARAERTMVLLTMRDAGPDVSDVPEGVLIEQDLMAPRLARELIRQSILIAARDGLGLPTRDAVLGEPIPTDAPWADQTLDLMWLGPQPIYGILLRGPERQIIFDAEILDEDWFSDHASLATRLEAMSRDQFIAALRKGGWEGQPNTIVADGGVPEEIANQLAEMDELSQYMAVRELHQLIRTSGESPARLGALARGYAHLGELTRYYWSNATEAHRARALLYADRMVATSSGSADARWHRAYVRALVGLHQAALDDVAAARALSADPQQPEPAWAGLVEPLCHYQISRLIEVANDHPDVTRIALYMGFMTLENSQAQGATMNVILSSLRENPTCMRLIDAACTRTGPGMLNRLTEVGPAVYSQVLGQGLTRTPGLPNRIHELIQSQRRAGGNPTGRKVVWKALRKEAAEGLDVQEPSLGVLADMIEQTTFVHVWRQADIIRNKWGVDASDYVDSAGPLVADHPCAPAVRQMRHDPDDIPARKAELEGIALPFGEYSLWFSWLPDTMFEADVKRDAHERSYWRQMFLGRSLTASDCELAMYTGTMNDKRPWVEELEKVSPHSPIAQAERISLDWSDENAARWEAEHGEHPAVAMALAKRYIALERWDDAIRNLRQYVTVSPDWRGYRMLSDTYWRMGDMAQWRATLDEFLTQPDYGLQHANVQRTIADQLMKEGNYREALPYALKAADTASSWGLECAAQVYEGLGNYEAAERYVVEEAEHYGYGNKWLQFCVRTGQGNRRGAMRMAEQYCAEYADTTLWQHQWEMGIIRTIQGRHAEAAEHYRRAYGGEFAQTYMILAAMEYEMLCDAAQRDAALETIAQNDQKGIGLNRPQLVEYGALLKEAFSSDQPLDPAVIDDLVARSRVGDQCNIRYFAAWHAHRRGDANRARELLRPCVTLDVRDFFTMTQAWALLRELGEEPNDLARVTPTTAPAAP